MNQDLKQPIPVTVNWSRVFTWSVWVAIAITIISLILRARTLILFAGILDVALILGAIGVAVYALIAKSTPKQK